MKVKTPLRIVLALALLAVFFIGAQQLREILSQLLELLNLKAFCLGKVFSQWLSTFSPGTDNTPPVRIPVRMWYASFLGKMRLVTLVRQFSTFCARARTHSPISHFC